MDRRVLFVRTGPMGNAIAAVPALRALKKAWPEARVSMMVERPSEKILENCPYVDEFIIYEKRGEQKGLTGWLRTVKTIRNREFTHVILSKRYFRMSFIVSLTGAPVRVGFAEYGYKLTETIAWQSHRQAIDTNLDLMAALGIAPDGRELEIWPSEDDRRQAVEFLEEKGLSGHRFIVAVHPGGESQQAIGWPVEKYAELAVALEKQYSAAPVLLGGPMDGELLEKFNSTADRRYPLASSLNIRSAAHLISLSRIFIGADSAPSHLAHAVGTPGIIYYGPKDDLEENIARWKPEGDLWIAAVPSAEGEHPAVKEMLGHVAELIHHMHERGRWEG